jgi:hypothetical protein
MASDDFAERLKSKETAKRDQIDGETEQKARRLENSAFIYANAKSNFLSMQRIAEKLVDVANQRLSGPNYAVGNSAGGFFISLGAHSAGFSYSQIFANTGEILMSVLIQQRQSNFEMFGLSPTETPKPTRQLTFEPVGDAATNVIAWRGNGRDLTGDELVKFVMTTLMDRA